MTHRLQVEAILAGARAEHRALLTGLSPALAASLPVDGSGLSQALDYLCRQGIPRRRGGPGAGEAAGLDLHQEQVDGHRTNAAVLHGSVFGREPLSRDTVQAAFVDGARVRAETLAHLAEAVGGDELAEDVRALLDSCPASADLAAAYAAQESAAVRIATHLDEAAR